MAKANFMGRVTFRCPAELHKHGISGEATLITGIALSFSRSYRITLPSPMNKLDEIIAYKRKEIEPLTQGNPSDDYVESIDRALAFRWK